MKPERESIKLLSLYFLVKFIVLVFFVIFVIYAGSLFSGYPYTKPQSLNDFADSLSGLFAPLAFAGVCIGLYFQRKEFSSNIEITSRQTQHSLFLMNFPILRDTLQKCSECILNQPTDSMSIAQRCESYALNYRNDSRKVMFDISSFIREFELLKISIEKGSYDDDVKARYKSCREIVLKLGPIVCLRTAKADIFLYVMTYDAIVKLLNDVGFSGKIENVTRDEDSYFKIGLFIDTQYTLSYGKIISLFKDWTIVEVCGEWHENYFWEWHCLAGKIQSENPSFLD